MTTTRRERVREATLREIKQVAREQLRAYGPSGISLRAIARDMGMTAPALYRYYASLDDLLTAMIESYKSEIREAVEAARDAVPPDDVAERLAAASRAFRRWALDNRPEFAMVFGAPVPGYERRPRRDGAEASAGFGAVFFELLAELWRRRPFPIPDDDDIPPALRRQLREFMTACGLDGGGLPLGVIRLYLGSWVRLYGLVAMEVFGHIHHMLDDPEPLFEAELADLARTLGVPATRQPADDRPGR